MDTKELLTEIRKLNHLIEYEEEDLIKAKRVVESIQAKIKKLEADRSDLRKKVFSQHEPGNPVEYPEVGAVVEIVNQPRYVIVDEAKAHAWCVLNAPGLIKTEIKKADLNRVMKGRQLSGEPLPDGTEIQEEQVGRITWNT